MPADIRKYVIVTPVRDEQEYIEKTINSVIFQTLQPLQWIIVNDGSTDDTGIIIDNYAKAYPWIKAVHRFNRGARVAGGGVIEAFYDGYGAISEAGWEFIVKLDGDLTFEPGYFKDCIGEFDKELDIGIGGGDIYHEIKGSFVLEKNPLFHVRGATKIYKRECWEAIGGLIKTPGWDTIDEVKANMLGWKTRSFNHLKVIHHRFTGAADGTWRNATKNGKANYISGYHPIFMLAKCMKRIFEKPYLIGALGLFYGFMSGYLNKIPQIDDKKLISYLRKQQLKRLMYQESIWK
ncbi:MAG: glycosyltransferase family A protein [Syntrophomonas sp.]